MLMCKTQKEKYVTGNKRVDVGSQSALHLPRFSAQMHTFAFKNKTAFQSDAIASHRKVRCFTQLSHQRASSSKTSDTAGGPSITRGSPDNGRTKQTNKQTKGEKKQHPIMTQRFRLSFQPFVRRKQAAKIMWFTSPNLRKVRLKHLSHIRAGEEKHWLCCFYILFLPKTAPMDG